MSFEIKPLPPNQLSDRTKRLYIRAMNYLWITTAYLILSFFVLRSWLVWVVLAVSFLCFFFAIRNLLAAYDSEQQDRELQ